MQWTTPIGKYRRLVTSEASTEVSFMDGIISDVSHNILLLETFYFFTNTKLPRLLDSTIMLTTYLLVHFSETKIHKIFFTISCWAMWEVTRRTTILYWSAFLCPFARFHLFANRRKNWKDKSSIVVQFLDCKKWHFLYKMKNKSFFMQCCVIQDSISLKEISTQNQKSKIFDRTLLWTTAELKQPVKTVRRKYFVEGQRFKSTS